MCRMRSLATVVVPDRPPGSSSLHLLKHLSWLPVEWRIEFKIATPHYSVQSLGNWPTTLPFPAVMPLCSYQSFMLFRIRTYVPKTSGLVARALFAYLLPLSGTSYLTAFVSAKLKQLSGNALLNILIFYRHSLAPPSDPLPQSFRLYF